MSEPGHQRAADLVKRDFTAARPNAVWVADFTYVHAWCGIVYVAFVVDVYSRAIVGWSASTSKRATLVLDALDMALWRRGRAGRPAGPGLIHHSDAGSRCTCFRFTDDRRDRRLHRYGRGCAGQASGRRSSVFKQPGMIVQVEPACCRCGLISITWSGPAH
ncbi:DDE-type integrase/transposase/recombinase [Microbispora hainanensis]|uniref:DDE-type integrase/transposase/recombinase n=1 Tax=Microbispora hainanensis TaxID=568844 RepID=UPI003AF35FFE